MNTHSPFEPGYIGNSDSGAVAVLDATFPHELLADAGVPADVLDRMASSFTDDLTADERLEAVRTIESLTPDGLTEFAREIIDEAARRDAYDALSPEEQAALTALSAEDADALRALTPEDRAALTAPAEAEAADEDPADPVGDVPGGKVADVIDWVGGDRGRAETALAVEENRDRPRQTLIVALEQLLTAGPPSE